MASAKVGAVPLRAFQDGTPELPPLRVGIKLLSPLRAGVVIPGRPIIRAVCHLPGMFALQRWAMLARFPLGKFKCARF